MTDRFRDHIRRLREAVRGRGLDVAASIGLRGRGKRFFCPVCQPSGGKTPDLVVMDGGFFCHKCGLKGDLLKLIEVTCHLDFARAVAWLESLTGIRPPEQSAGVFPNKVRFVNRPPEAIGPARTHAGGEGAIPIRPEVICDVYDAFLAACRHVEGAALDWLTREKGIAPEVIETCRLRFCGREYLDIVTALKSRIGEDALLMAGILKRSKSGRPVPSFWHYYAKKVGFLVIPYILHGRPVYLKARPPVSKEKAERLGLVRFLNTAAAVPCLYNADVLTARPVPDKVLVCEGESDTWTALSYGFAAVGSPGAKNFKASWVESFRPFQSNGQSRVYLVPDNDPAGAAGAKIIADLFLQAGIPIPLKLTIPKGKDLSEYMRDMPKEAQISAREV